MYRHRTGGPILEHVEAFADGAHCAMKQTRKGTGADYIVHPRAVLEVLNQAQDCTDTMRAAALLHDVLEDTGIVKLQIGQRFGRQVAELVDEVTDVAKPEDGDRAARARVNRAHLAKASADAQTIKLADIIANVDECHHLPPSFARVWLLEKAAALEVLTKGDPKLLKQAEEAVYAALNDNARK